MYSTLDQTALYEKHILPNESDLISRILGYRTKIDRIFEELSRDDFLDNPHRQLNPTGIKDIQRYPAGHCLDIQKHVMILLQGENLEYMRNFREAGGIFQKRWMLSEERGIKAFSNVIEIGDRIIDPTADEFLDIPVRVSRKIENIYRDVSVEGYIKTAEEYWGCRIFRTDNIIGPELAHFFPTVAVTQTGKIDFLSKGQYDMNLLVDTGAGESADWLADPDNMHYEFPPEFQENIDILAKELSSNIFSRAHVKMIRAVLSAQDHIHTKASSSKIFMTDKMAEFRSHIGAVFSSDDIWEFYIEYVMLIAETYNMFVEKGVLRNINGPRDV